MALTVFVVAAAVPGGGAADRFPDAELGKDRMDGVASPAVCRYPGFDGVLGGEADVPDDVAAISQRAESEALGQELRLGMDKVGGFQRRESLDVRDQPALQPSR